MKKKIIFIFTFFLLNFFFIYSSRAEFEVFSPRGLTAGSNIFLDSPVEPGNDKSQFKPDRSIALKSNAQSDYSKKLFIIGQNLEIIDNKNKVIKFTLNNEFPNKKNSRRNSPIVELQQAKRHLILGNPLAAIEDVNRNISFINVMDLKTLSFAYKLLFEAYRMTGKNLHAIDICSKMVLIDKANNNYFDNKWIMLCSYTFLQASKLEKSEELKQSLVLWSLNPFFKATNPYTLLSESFIALAIRNMNLGLDKSINYIKGAIAKSKKQETYLAHAYFILSLLYFESGKKDLSFNIIQDLATSYSINKAGYKYFPVNPHVRILSRLSLARFYLSLGNLQESKIWFEDVLKDKNVQDGYLNGQKKKLIFLYSVTLYKLKLYADCAKNLKLLIEDQNGNDLLYAEDNLKVSRLLLANILNLSSEKNKEGGEEILKLYDESGVDLEFLKKNDEKIAVKYEDIKEKIIPLVALARDYELDSKESNYFVKTFIDIDENEKKFDNNIKNFTNALNSIDYSGKGIYAGSILSSIEDIRNNITFLRRVIFQIDKFSVELWDKESKTFNISLMHRNEILKSLNSLDDQVSNYSSKILIKEKIYKNYLLENIKIEYKKLKKIKAIYSLSLFNNEPGIASKYQSEFNIQEKILASLLLDYRKNILLQEIHSSDFYSLKKMLDIMNNIVPKLYELHSVEVLKYGNKHKNIYSVLIDKNWKKIININNDFLSFLKLAHQKLNLQRYEFLNYVNKINYDLSKTTSQKSELLKMGENNFIKLYSILSTQLTYKIKEFRGFINLSVAKKSKNNYEFYKSNLETEIKLKEQRNKWLQTLQNSTNWGTFR